jgi:drug/metabolite transporter (DMT)-like permease
MLSVFAQVGDISGDVVEWTLSGIKWIVQKFQAKEYGLGVSGLIMMLVFAFNKYFKKLVPAKALPWVAVGVGVLTAVATKLAGIAMGTPTTEWLTVIGSGVISGATASGLWSLLGKHFFGAKAAPQDPPAPSPGA